MRTFHSKLVMLLVFLIGFAFIALGLTLGQYWLTEICEYQSCTAGLPIP